MPREHKLAIVTTDDVTLLRAALNRKGYARQARAILTRLDDTFAEYEPAKIEQAQSEYGREGEIEIDEGAVCSRGGDPGCYVQAWVWCADPEEEDE